MKVGIYLFQSWVSTSYFCLISAIVKILGTTPKTHLSCYQYSKLLKGGRVLKIFVQGTYMKRLTKNKNHTWLQKNPHISTCLKFHNEEKNYMHIFFVISEFCENAIYKMLRINRIFLGTTKVLFIKYLFLVKNWKFISLWRVSSWSFANLLEWKERNSFEFTTRSLPWST